MNVLKSLVIASYERKAGRDWSKGGSLIIPHYLVGTGAELAPLH
jgi:hypothetical protein